MTCERCDVYTDFSLEEEYLFGSLCITIDGLKGLKQSAGLQCDLCFVAASVSTQPGHPSVGRRNEYQGKLRH